MKKDIPQLHAIRSLAMAAIFFHHLWLGLPDLGRLWRGTPLDASFQAMSLGVVVFNVMAAFLMGLPFFGPTPAPIPRFGEFLRKRLWRLYPQYGLCVLGFTLLSAVVFQLTDWRGLAEGVASHLLFLDNFQVAPFYGNMAAYWWLGLLVQFTLIYPWLIRLILRPGFGPARCCLVAALVMWPVTVWIKAQGAAAPGTNWDAFAFLWTFNLPSRLPELLCGIWMAKAFREHVGGGWPFGRGLAFFLGGGCLAALCSVVIPGAPSLGHMSGAVWSLGLFAVLFCLPVMAAMGERPFVRQFSNLTYGMYLAHQPLLSYAGAATAGLSPGLRFAIQAVVVGGASILAGWLVERTSEAVVSWLRCRLAATAPALSQKRIR
jgi:peptidoglycan/LPS O-acetylase OafA/YrhL